MTERDALLRGVLREPADDVARLVMADYLDENGEADRAQFIRLQVEHAKSNWPKHLFKPHCVCKSCRSFRHETRILDAQP